MSAATQVLAREIEASLPEGVGLDSQSQLATFGDGPPLWGIEVQGTPVQVKLAIVVSSPANLLELADEIRGSAKLAARKLDVAVGLVDVHVAKLDDEAPAARIGPAHRDGGSGRTRPEPA